jgi:hypothetical protein
MVIVAVSAVVPAVTVNAIVPLLPLAGSPVTSVGSLAEAVQGQPAVLKVKAPVPPVEPKTKLVGETERAEQLTAAWFTVKVATTSPPLDTVIDPLRAAPVLASTL